MIVHILIRFIIAALAFLTLGIQLFEKNNGGGNSGMDIKLGLLISLSILLLGGVYLVGEMFFLFYKAKYKLAIVDLGLLILGIVIFLILASR